MPVGEVSRYKEIHCKKCGKLIKRFDRSKYADWHVPPAEILSAIRKHYKKEHPITFRRSIKKGVKARSKG